MENKDIRRQLSAIAIPNEEAIERRCVCRIKGLILEKPARAPRPILVAL